MARRSTLRSVPPSKQAAKNTQSRARCKTVAQAAKSGNRRELLEAVRDRIAVAVSKPDCPARELNGLLKQLDDVMDKLDALDESATDSGGDSDSSDDSDDSFDASVI